MRTLIIEFNGPKGRLEVVDSFGRRCDGLTLGETLEQIIHMHYKGEEKFEMLTDEDRERKIAERRAKAGLTTTQEPTL